MALRLKGVDLTGVLDFPKVSDFSLLEVMGTCPIKDGLVGAYFIGSKNADPTYNFANPKVPLLKVGYPDINPKYAELSRSTGYFDTQIASTNQMTVVALSVCPAKDFFSSGIALVSNYQKTGASLSGDSLMTKSNGVQAYASQNGSLVNSLTAVGSSEGDYIITGMIVGAQPAVGSFVSNEDGSVTRNITTMSSRGVSGKNLLIGATQSTSEFLSKSKVSAVVIFDTDINGNANMALVMNWLRNTVGTQVGIF